MITSKVIRDNRRHITRSDYNDKKPLLDSENVLFPRKSTLQARSLRRMLTSGVKLSHREFDCLSYSYCLRSYIDNLRDKGWTIVNHDEVALTKDPCKRTAKFTRYELFADFSPELAEKIAAFCKAVDDYEMKKGGDDAARH